MKQHKALWLALGLVIALLGIFLLGDCPWLGIVLIIAGVAVLMLVSIRIMIISGGVKDNYFHQGGDASQRFAPQNPEVGDIWQDLTKKREDQK